MDVDLVLCIQQPSILSNNLDRNNVRVIIRHNADSICSKEVATRKKRVRVSDALVEPLISIHNAPRSDWTDVVVSSHFKHGHISATNIAESVMNVALKSHIVGVGMNHSSAIHFNTCLNTPSIQFMGFSSLFQRLIGFGIRPSEDKGLQPAQTDQPIGKQANGYSGEKLQPVGKITTKKGGPWALVSGWAVGWCLGIVLRKYKSYRIRQKSKRRRKTEADQRHQQDAIKSLHATKLSVPMHVRVLQFTNRVNTVAIILAAVGIILALLLLRKRNDANGNTNEGKSQGSNGHPKATDSRNTCTVWGRFDFIPFAQEELKADPVRFHPVVSQ